MDWLSACYRFLGDYKVALLYKLRVLVLVLQLHGARSKEHALALKGLYMVHAGLEAFPEARKAIIRVHWSSWRSWACIKTRSTDRCCWGWASWTINRSGTRSTGDI